MLHFCLKIGFVFFFLRDEKEYESSVVMPGHISCSCQQGGLHPTEVLYSFVSPLYKSFKCVDTRVPGFRVIYTHGLCGDIFSSLRSFGTDCWDFSRLNSNVNASSASDHLKMVTIYSMLIQTSYGVTAEEN